MMKKLLILTLALAIASYATAATVSLIVDPEDAKPSYSHSDLITIWMVGSGFTPIPPNGFCSFVINGGIMGPGEASNPQVNALYLPQLKQPGTPINDGVQLIDGPITGTAAMGDLTGVPNGQPAYSFDYIPPERPSSTIITIYITDITVSGSFGAPIATDLVPLELHIIPEPMTIVLLSLGGLFLRRRR